MKMTLDFSGTIFRMLVILLVISGILSCTQQPNQQSNKEYPQPFETTVKMDMEDYHHSEARNKWFDLLHTAAPGVSWQEIEQQNSRQNLAYRNQIRSQVNTRGDEVQIADGQITGEWSERGSSNQAGSVFHTAFDSESDEIYVVSAGGTIFKSHISGDSWRPLNDDIQFHSRFIVWIPEDNRLVAAIDNQPHYSEDDGLTWTPSTGVEATLNSTIVEAQHIIGTNNILYFGFNEGGFGSYSLYHSDDGGLSFQSIHTINTPQQINFKMTIDHSTNDLYVIEQITGETSKLMKLDVENKDLVTIQEASPIGFGALGRANLTATTIEGEDLPIFRAYDENNFVHTSRDLGETWEVSGEAIPETPWEVGMTVSKHNPNHLQAGGVDSYRSYDGGDSWNRINNWWEYYPDPNRKLHADVMSYNEYTTSESQDIVLNMNHGGMYVSNDDGLTYQNIGLEGLNVAQYYSVRSLPANPTNVFAGSQDQGLQRGVINFEQEGDSSFDQVISGDYGHIIFTDNGSKLWTVYPFGWVTYYASPIGDPGPTMSYEIISNNETVWLPPMIPDADPSKNVIYVAGGSATGGSGSYIIKMEPDGGEIKATNLPHDFATSGGTIAALAMDYLDPNRMYVSTTNRQYFYSTDAGQTFTRVALPVLEGNYLYGAHIIPSKSQPGVVYMAGSGYSNAGVVKSENGGITYSAMANGLPPTAVLDIAVSDDDRFAFAATEAGPYMYIAEDNKWYEMAQATAPKQTYWSVEIVPFTDIVRFGTYGRGIWDFEITSTPLISSTDELSEANNIDFTIYPNPTSQLLNISLDTEEIFNDIQIFDLQGKLIINQSMTSNNAQVDVNHLQEGTYTVRIIGDKETLSKQFIKQ
jgi:photosystem II stability/assembly factor-like uncharacterized protein